MPIASSAASRATTRRCRIISSTRRSLAPADHVVVQAAVQQYVDSSISKTINVPADFPFEQFKDVYLQAYELGCKGCTTYRPNDVTGAVLEVQKRGARTSAAPQHELPLPRRRGQAPQDVYEAGGVVYMTQPLDRPEALPGHTYKIKWPDSDHALLHHHQRHREGRPPPPLRDLHQLEEHGALCLDAGADPHDQRGVPARRRCLLRGRGAEGRVRSARRRLDGAAIMCPRCWPRSAT